VASRAPSYAASYDDRELSRNRCLSPGQRKCSAGANLPGPSAHGRRRCRFPRALRNPTLRVHDLRHTCASIWLAAGADPKVVQGILGHASAAMTMDLYGHLVAQNLWDAAEKIGGTTGAPGPLSDRNDETPGKELGL
jgi:integrase